MKINSKDSINEDSEWKDDYRYHVLGNVSDVVINQLETLAKFHDPRAENSTFYMDKIANIPKNPKESTNIMVVQPATGFPVRKITIV